MPRQRYARVLLRVLGAAFLICGILHAQQANELALELGGTFTPSRQVAGGGPALAFDPAFTLGIEYDRRIALTPLGPLSAGIDFDASPFDVKTNAGPGGAISQYAYLFLTPHLRLKLHPVGPVEPFFSAGIGYANYAEGAYRNGSANTHTGTTGPTGEVTAGFDYSPPLKLFLPLAFRLDARDFIAAPPSYNAPVPRSQNNVIVSFGIVLKF